MPAISPSTVALLVSVALMWTANGLCFTLLAVRLNAEGYSASDVGIVTTGYFIGQLVGAIFCGRMIERVGHVRAFAAFASIVSASVIGYALYVDLTLWTVLRALHGMCIAGSVMVAESWLNGATSNQGRGRLLAVYTIIQYLAMSAGQQLLNLQAPTSFVLFTVASILFSLALVPLVLSRSVTAGEVVPSRLSFLQLVKISPLGVIGCFAGGALVAILFGLMPVYLGERGYEVFDIALFMSVIILGGLVVQYPVGRASDVFDRRTVIAVTLFAGGGVCFAIALAPALGFWSLAGMTVLYGGIVYALYPLAVSHANDFLDPADLVAASAGLIMAMAVGAALGPLATAVVMETAGPDGIYTFSGGICLSLGAFAVFRMTRRAAVSNEEQGPYVLLSRTTAASAELDPRADLDGEGELEPDYPSAS
jgi:MFS family permease